MEGGDDANEDERAEARSVILCRLLGVVRAVRRDWELVVLSEDLVVQHGVVQRLAVVGVALVGLGLKLVGAHRTHR